MMERSTDPLHLYRALLRAATYLPDSFARAYMHDYLVYRFRSTCGKAKGTIYRSIIPGGKSDKDITCQQIDKARQSLRSLQRAGNGNLDDLRKVLLLSYGRKGRRKRSLIGDLLRPDESNLPKDDLALEDLINAPTRKPSLRFDPGSKFSAFLRSQAANHPIQSDTSKIRHVLPNIPKENIWLRPVPVKLRASKEKKWWATVLDKLLPPIPQDEWNRLRDLAMAQVPLEKSPPRRSAKSFRLSWKEHDMKVLEYLRFPAKVEWTNVEGVNFDPDRGLSPLLVGISSGGAGDTQRTHTNREWRRFYTGIWSMTSTMAQDEVTKQWTVHWGGGNSVSHPEVISKPSANDHELFEGLNILPVQKIKVKKRRMKGQL